MPKSRSCRLLLKSVPRFYLFLIAMLLLPALLLLGYYLHLVGILPLPSALTERFASHPQADDPSKYPHSVVLPMSDPRSTQHFSYPGIRQPPTRSAQEASLPEDAEVIGVFVEGKARAYSIAAMSKGPESHVINDLLAGHPVTVAYCNVMNCARTFTANSSGTPLDLGVGGWEGVKGLIVQLGGKNYVLKDGKNLSTPKGPPLPCQEMDHQRMTWGDWHRAHPDTDVYVGTPKESAHGG